LNPNKIIVVDFDGTIVDFKYPSIGEPKPGVREALTRFRELGYSIVVSSCRNARRFPEIFQVGIEGQPVVERQTYKDMIKFMDDHQLPYDEIDDGSLGKPLGNLYIDDKGVRFENNWTEIQRFVEVHQP
jgi:predicted HAD superfamily phosphohydrolase YqeG